MVRAVDDGFRDLFAGALTAGAFFDEASELEREIRETSERLYNRADWPGPRKNGLIVHGWRPETGFLPYSWEGYNEALILYVLALGSPSHPVKPESYVSWTKSYRWKTLHGEDLLYAGPLFTHQLSHIWIDFRGIRDAFMRGRNADYFENSRRATLVQQRYRNGEPSEVRGIQEILLGHHGERRAGNAVKRVRGVLRTLLRLSGPRGSFGPDDGTISPWATSPRCRSRRRSSGRRSSSSTALSADAEPVRLHVQLQPDVSGRERETLGRARVLRLDPGDVVLMIENYRSALYLGPSCVGGPG